MKTDDLIRGLAQDTVKERALSAILVPGMAVAVGFSMLALWMGLGFRADLVQSLGAPVSLARFLLTAALGFIGLRLALVLARPDGRGRANLGWLAAVGAAALGLLIWAYVATPADGRQMAFVGKTITKCLVMIPLLSVIPVAVLLATLRRGATTVPALAGFVAGLGGSGVAAAVYAMHCTEDSPLFYVTWYSLAIAGVTITSTLIGSRLLRW
jgi:hypothetical protein